VLTYAQIIMFMLALAVGIEAVAIAGCRESSLMFENRRSSTYITYAMASVSGDADTSWA